MGRGEGERRRDGKKGQGMEQAEGRGRERRAGLGLRRIGIGESRQWEWSWMSDISAFFTRPRMAYKAFLVNVGEGILCAREKVSRYIQDSPALLAGSRPSPNIRS